MAFEVFERQRTRTVAPRVAINKLGRLSINSSATKILKMHPDVKNVFLMWDKTTRQVGIKPSMKSDQRTYPLTSYGKKENSASGFSAVSFLRHINFDFSETHTFPVEWSSKDAMLIFSIPAEMLTADKTVWFLNNKTAKGA